MGKKSWFSAMKKAMSPSISKTKKEKRSNKPKSNPKNSRHVSLDACSSQTEAALTNPFHHNHPIMEMDFKVPENEQIKHVDSITYTTTVAEDVVNRSNSHFLGKTMEEISAIKIQAAYRGHMARRAFRSLRAMWRLNLWLQGQAVKRQTESMLMRMQTVGRVQSQVRARRIRMAEVNEALQRQLIQKRRKVLEKQAFDLSPKSKAQLDASIRSKKEAAERREKALAYAYTRQQTWRNAHKSALVNPNHIDWGWSWSHRCDANKPWEAYQVQRQSPVKRSMSPNSKSSKSQTPKAGPSRVNTRCRVGLANKQHLVTGSVFTAAPRIAVR